MLALMDTFGLEIVDHDFVRIFVDRQTSEAEQAILYFFLLARFPTKVGLHASDNFIDAERLRNIVVSADIVATDKIVRCSLTGEHDHRNLLGIGVQA